MKSRNSFNFRIWASFISFAFFIFISLWLIQTVSIDGIYNSFVIRHIRRTAARIVRNDYPKEMIGSLARNDHCLITVFGGDGELLFRADEHIPEDDGQASPKMPLGYLEERFAGFYHEAVASMESSGVSSLEYFQAGGRIYVNVSRYPDGRVLFISAPLGTMPLIARMLRIQLVMVSVFTFICSLIITKFLSERLSDAKKERSRLDLLSNVTHDLRTPITLIRGYAELISDTAGSDAEEIKGNAGIIVRESDRLSRLVNDIIQYTKDRNAMARISESAFDFSALVRNAVSSFSISGKIEVDAPDAVLVRADRDGIERVVNNFLANAVSYSAGDGSVRIKVIAMGQRVRFEIRDFGSGISEGDLGRIWDRYFSARQSRIDGEHHGLGLAVCKEILDMHGARYGAANADGGGSVFWFELRSAGADG